MSLMPFWFRLRHLRNLAHRDPFAILERDPFFRDPAKFIQNTFEPWNRDHYGIKGVYSDTEVKVDGKKVEVHLDVQNFTPEQIQVKTIGNEIMVEGKKEIKKEDGWTRSHFERRFVLPEGFPPERVECHFDKGKLMLIAFRSVPVEEKSIPVRDKSSDSGQASSESEKS